jgi:hypothetical protein
LLKKIRLQKELEQKGKGKTKKTNLISTTISK